MNRILKIQVLGLLIICTSCLSVKISSIKSDEPIKPIKKLFVSLRGSKATEVFFENMRFGLYEGFNKRTVQSSYYIKRALSLETDADVQKRMSDFAADNVIIIELSELQSGTSQIDNTVYSFDIRLMNQENTKILWRATLDLNSSVKSEAAAKNAAASIITKMDEDGLFPK